MIVRPNPNAPLATTSSRWSQPWSPSHPGDGFIIEGKVVKVLLSLTVFSPRIHIALNQSCAREVQQLDPFKLPFFSSQMFFLRERENRERESVCVFAYLLFTFNSPMNLTELNS